MTVRYNCRYNVNVLSHWW